MTEKHECNSDRKLSTALSNHPGGTRTVHACTICGDVNKDVEYRPGPIADYNPKQER